MADEAYSDIVSALITYLRADSTLKRLVGQRVFRAVNANAAMPFVLLSEVGGGDSGDTPMEEIVVRFTIRGRIDDIVPVRARLRSILKGLSMTRLDASTVCHGVTVDSILMSPDQVNDMPQFVITARVTSIAA